MFSWKDILVVKGTGCLLKRPGFDSQHIHGSSKPSIILDLRNKFFFLCSTNTAYIQYIYIDLGKTSIHIK